MAKQTTKDLTEGNPARLIVEYSLPILLGNLFQQLYNMIDTMIVGRLLGVDALAGVGATGSVSFLIVGFCIGVCSGFAIPLAHRFGARDEEGLKKHLANSYILSAGFSLVVTIIVSLLCKNILIWMGTPEDILEYSYQYILVIFLGIPVTFVYNILSGAIRAVGDSKTPLIFLIIASVLNIFLDYILIGHIGVAGAALATVTSQAFSGLLCIIAIKRRFKMLHISFRHLKPDPDCIKRLCGMGIPMGLQYSITAIGSVILQTSINSLGSLAVASITAANKVSMVFACILDAMGAAMATYGGQNVGAKRIDRVDQGLRACIIMGIVYSIFAFIVLRFTGRFFISLFIDSPSEELLSNASYFLTVVSAFYILLAFVNIVRFLIQGMGFSTLAILAGVLEMVARTVTALALVPHFGFVGACFASPLAWILADAFLFPAYFYVRKRLKKSFGQA
ncbi:MAG: MATE family efflux transporter [Lachnospiraceae bacterium]|nr:MATE family efflux transporter [Lachnospiraceae bacterium]